MLKETQECFGKDILATEHPEGNYITQKKFNSTQLLQVYQNNYYSNLLSALRAAYPTLLSLVGEEFIDAIGRLFIEQVPFAEGDLTYFGAGFSDYIKTSEHCQSMPYLPAVARLDWAFECAYNAADKIEKLDVPGASTAVINPSVQVVQSRYPIFDLWQFDGEGVLDINSGGQSIVIWKHHYEVLAEKIDDDVANKIKKITSGDTPNDLDIEAYDWLAKGVVY